MMTLHFVNERYVSKRSGVTFPGSVLTLAIVLFGFGASKAVEAASDDAASSQGLEEIVVTANKREQNLNDVGLAVAVLGRNELKNQGISSLADIAQSVPGLSYTPTPTSTPV